MMSISNGDGEVEASELYARWTVDTRNKPNCFNKERSEYVLFQSDAWCLDYFYDKGEHILYLYNLTHRRRTPFDITVQVKGGDSKRAVQKDMTAKLRFEAAEIPRHTGHPDDYMDYIDDYYYVHLWAKPESEVVRAYPEFRRNKNLLFLVELKCNDVLADTDAGSTRSNSILTTLLPDAISSLQSLSEDLTRLMVQGLDSDVDLQCSGQTIKAHKSIVCSRSPVIASMLSTDMLEGRTGVVRIANMEPDTFSRLIRYIYSGKLQELTFDTALKLYEAADQYAVHSLAKRCSEFLLKHLSVDNACDALVVADAHSNKDFVEKVVEFMVDSRVPLVREDWSDFCKEHSDLAFKVLNRGWKFLAK